MFFDHKKLKIFNEIYFKFISCVRKVVLKWFQNDSDSLETRKSRTKGIGQKLKDL